MCFSNATLFYGLWVTTTSLDFAATAHKATRPTILAIDLTISRRRRGKLETKGQDERTTARELPPEEMWELVKDQLLGVAVEKAEEDRLSSFRCQWCIEQAWGVSGTNGWCPYHSDGPEPGPLYTWSRWSEPGCDSCLDNILDSNMLYGHTADQLAVNRNVHHTPNLRR
jgi:hypothetical protein